jgi:hypothetical protein
MEVESNPARPECCIGSQVKFQTAIAGFFLCRASQNTPRTSRKHKWKFHRFPAKNTAIGLGRKQKSNRGKVRAGTFRVADKYNSQNIS